MHKKKFVAIGHIVNDIEPFDHLGGGVSYTAVTASRLGLEAHILTKCPSKHPYISYLSSLGVNVHVLPSKLDTITTFKNIYSASGKRTQTVPQKQELITAEDLNHIDLSFLQDSFLVVATVIGEVDKSVLPILHNYANISIVPQGYLRRILPSGKVVAQVWRDLDAYTKNVDEVILSDEDLSTNGIFNESFLHDLQAKVPVVIMTQGHLGSTVFSKGKKKITALALAKKEIIDFTGAGDVYAAAFLCKYAQTKLLKESAVFASLYATVKITAKGGIGIASIPTQQEFKKFIQTHKAEMSTYLAENNMTEREFSALL